MNGKRLFFATLLGSSLLLITACGGSSNVGGDADITDTDTTIQSPPLDTDTGPISDSSSVLPCTSDETKDCIHIDLPCTSNNVGWYGHQCLPEKIEIPHGRPVYAFLVSGFHQNRNLDLFHFYNFAQCVMQKGGYVHYAWWNNLLAPYMERPLHNSASVPSIESYPDHDILWFLLSSTNHPNKAIPPEDHQFQFDAETVLRAIARHNSSAAIILVGHSMGGDAIARLAENTDVDIDVLAPIDPVGNRTCLEGIPSWEGGSGYTVCGGTETFERKDAVYTDFWDAEDHQGRVRLFDTNIKYLYHRWQTEFSPPLWDWWLDGQYFNYHNYLYPPLNTANMLTYSVDEAYHHGSTHVQVRVLTDRYSGFDVPPTFNNAGGPFDGHGEIVGFRGVRDVNMLQTLFDLGQWADVFNVESYPLALLAQGDWPSREKDPCNRYDSAECTRVEAMKEWEASVYGLSENAADPFPHAPTHTHYCMVSGDLCTILRTVVQVPEYPANSAPVADAGQDQVLECSSPDGTDVQLDGSGSSDPDSNDELVFTWEWLDGTSLEEAPLVSFPLGTHPVTLAVHDGELSDTDTVVVTVQDTMAPSLTVYLSPDSLWAPNRKMVKITASIEMSDSCDMNPIVKLVSITSNEIDDSGINHYIQGAEFGTDDREFWLKGERSGNGLGRVYAVTYESIDASGNVTETTTEVTVPHDHHD